MLATFAMFARFGWSLGRWSIISPIDELVNPVSGRLYLRAALVNLASPLVVGWLAIGLRLRWTLARGAPWHDLATLPISRRDMVHALLLAVCLMAATFGVALKGSALVTVFVRGWVAGDWDEFGYLLYNHNRWFSTLGVAPEGGAYALLVTQRLVTDLVSWTAGLIVPALIVATARNAAVGVLGAFAACLGMTALWLLMGMGLPVTTRSFLAPLSSDGIFIDTIAICELATSIGILIFTYRVFRARFERGPLPRESTP